jgi:hypothetical protein
MIPLLVVAAFTVALAAPEPVVAEVPPEFPVFAGDVVVLLVLEDPQAARVSATATRAATANPVFPGRGDLRRRSICGLVIFHLLQRNRFPPPTNDPYGSPLSSVCN